MMTDFSQKDRKTLLQRNIKKISFMEKLSIRMSAEVIKEFITDLSLIPKPILS